MITDDKFRIEPEIIIIEAKENDTNANTKKKKIRVCAYARVSTESEQQEYSFENQRNYFKKLIESNNDWEYVGIYSDHGLSGKSIKRPQFLTMLEECRAGNIDKIITKSISRFARNTIDCMQTIRELREKGIGVYFEKEGLDSLDPNSSLVLSILAVVAEEESRSISNNIRWAIQKQYAKGRYLIKTKSFLGYARGDKNELVTIIPSQALTIRKIYYLYLEGKSLRQICLDLDLSGEQTPRNIGKWHESTIKSILSNEKYMGDCLLQKTYSLDFLSSKRASNNGNVQSYYVKYHHAPIVSRDEFDAVQVELARRNEIQNGPTYRSKYSNVHRLLSTKIICTECGGYMRRHIQYRKNGGVGYWVCPRHDERKCSMVQIKESAIIESLQIVLLQIIFGNEKIKETIIRTIEDCLNESQKRIIGKLNARIRRARDKLQKLQEQYQNDEIDYDTYSKESRPLLHVEPFLDLLKDETIYKRRELCGIGERTDKIIKIVKTIGRNESIDLDILNYIVAEICIRSSKIGVCKLTNDSEYYMIMDTWMKGSNKR